MKKTKTKTQDKRTATSAENGRKGGRPEYLYRTFQVFIPKTEIQSASEKNDLALAVEVALKKAMPGHDIYVQTQARLEKAHINFDPYSPTVNVVMVNSHPVKFSWELRYFFTEFLPITKGKKDYRFPFKVPTAILERDK